MQPNIDLGASVAPLLRELESWWEGGLRLLPNAAIALVVFGGAWLAARLAHRFTRNALQRASPNVTLNHLGAGVARLVVLGAGVSVALSVLGLEQAVASLLAGVGVLGIVLGLAVQESGANLVSGVFMAFRQPFRVGDIIRSGDLAGVVEDIELRATLIRQFSGERILIPNKQLFGEPVENWTSYGRRRIDVAVGVAYASDLDHVRRVSLEAALAVPGRHPDHPPEVLFTGFGESSVDLVVRLWAEYRSNAAWLAVRSDLVAAIHRAYAANGVEIPFPVRTVTLAPNTLEALARDQGR